MATRPNVTHHTGQEFIFPVTVDTATAGSSATFAFPYQSRIISGRWTAGTAGTGAGTMIIGTSNGTSNIVSAVSISNSTNASLTIIDQVIDAEQLVTVTIGGMTDAASAGGMLTFWVEQDQKADLAT